MEANEATKTGETDLIAARDSFERCDTDGFLNQWADRLAARKGALQAEIENNGGVAEFPALFTVAGEFVPAKIIVTKFGARWQVLTAEGKTTGEFLPFQPARRSTLANKGYTEGSVLRPAAAELAGGQSGTSSVVVAAIAQDKPWEQPVKVIETDRFSK